MLWEQEVLLGLTQEQFTVEHFVFDVVHTLINDNFDFLFLDAESFVLLFFCLSRIHFDSAIRGCKLRELTFNVL